MSNLVDYAKDELKRIGMIDSGDPYNDFATNAILNLIELFASQDHTGFTANYAINAFNRLARFKPLSPLTGKDDEWNEVGTGVFQNKRYSAVFKDKDDTAYDIEGKVFTDDGETWYTCRDSRVNVTFPYKVPDKPEHVYMNKEDKAKAYGDWIPVKSSLPENNEDVLVTDGSDIFVAWYASNEWYSNDNQFSPFRYPIVAWMLLPEQYKAEESEE